MACRVCVPLAAGFEEIEAMTIIDVLRRAGVEVKTAGLEPGPVEGSHGIQVIADLTLADALDRSWDAVVLPGGMPGAANLKESKEVQELLRRTRDGGKHLGAICAAPIALQQAGILKGARATSYPGFRDQVPDADYVEERVVRDGRLVTSRGPGTALEFALALVEDLVGAAAAAGLADRMLVERTGGVSPRG